MERHDDQRRRPRRGARARRLPRRRRDAPGYWLLLHAVGVDAPLFDAIAVLIAVVTLGLLAVGAAAAVLILAHHGVAATAAASCRPRRARSGRSASPSGRVWAVCGRTAATRRPADRPAGRLPGVGCPRRPRAPTSFNLRATPVPRRRERIVAMPTPPSSSFPRPPRPRSASPAERSAEFAEAQRRLKQEAADRRREADAKADEQPTDRGRS